MAEAVSNVKLKTPTIKVKNWTKDSRLWRALYRKAGGGSRLYPLTIKAGYVIGVIHGICESVPLNPDLHVLLLNPCVTVRQYGRYPQPSA